MGLFSKKKSKDPEPSPDIIVDAEHTYQSMSRFKGTKRMRISMYGDEEHGMENAAKLLGDADRHDCTGSEITLTSFRHHGGSGIKVAIDGTHIGVVWSTYYDYGDDPVYKAAYSGDISGVFVRIERTNVLDEETEQFVSRPRASLFVKLAE